MSNLIQILLFTAGGIIGIGILFLYLQSQKGTVLKDVKKTFYLGAALSAAASFILAFSNLNINDWLLFAAMIAEGFFITQIFVQKQEPMSYSRSMAEAEKKSDMTLLIALSAANVLFFLCNYVFNTDMKAFMQAATTTWNVLGIVLHIGSIGFLWYLAKGTDGHGTAGDNGGPVIVWGILLGLAICASTGFNFDYFNIR